MMRNVKILIYIGSFLVVFPFMESQAEFHSLDPYAIPRDKSVEQRCRQSALAARPGDVVSFHIHNTKDGIHYQYEIENQGKTWTVICDGAIQKIIKNEQQE